MSISKSQQLIALCDYYTARRDAILQAWRKADRADPDQTTGRSLTFGQFLDHIPEILDAFESRLRSRPGGFEAAAADANMEDEGVKHGLHRWQQGYRLKELINERMQQAEAAGHLGDLRGALASVNQIERHRSTLFHQAVHDLKNDVVGVNLAASLLGDPTMAESDRLGSTTYLKQAVQGLNTMLEELMELVRLQAGQETRKIGTFDAAVLLTELCAAQQPFARERQLFLKVQGPARLAVDGDAEKTRRLAKNLVVNALKYTPSGGVEVTWGEEKENWWLMVMDTGPGMLSGPGTPRSFTFS